MGVTVPEAAQELLRRRKSRKSVIEYISYTNPKYKRSLFSDIVCATIDKFISDVQSGKRPILILQAPPQHGKALSALVSTTCGWKQHDDLQVGDTIFAPDGATTQVIATSEKYPLSARVEFTDGSIIYCHERHEWTVYSRDLKRYVTLETQEMLKLGRRSLRTNPLFTGIEGERGCHYQYQLPPVTPLQGIERELPVAPYSLGAWLGDGTRVSDCITSDWRDVAIANGIANDGYPIKSISAHKTTGVLRIAFTDLLSALRKAGVTSIQGKWKPKFIPVEYLTASLEQRLQLLAGLMDTDRYIHRKNGRAVFTTADEELGESFAHLIATFGWRATTVVEQPKLSSSGIQGKKPYWVITFNPDIEIPCRLARKQFIPKTHKRRISIRSITMGEWGKSGKCIQVDRGDGLYLVGPTLIPTHNSEIVSRKLPPFLLGRFPDCHVATASYSDELASTMAQDVRRNLASPEHLRLFPAPQDKQKYVVNRIGEFTAPGGTGTYKAVGVGTGLTGLPVTIGIIDDPIKNEKEALSSVSKEGHWNWYQSVFTTRLSENSGQIIMATSWAEDDLPARVAAHYRGDPRLTHLRFPAINAPDEVGYNPVLPEGALCPELHSIEKLRETKSLLSDYWWSAMYQQSAKALGGNVFKEAGIQYYLLKDLPKKFDKVINSWDCTFKDTDGTDYVVGQVWGKLGANSYLLAQTRGRLSFTNTCKAIIKLRCEWPRTREILIEDKANGPAVIDTLKAQVPCIIPIEPDGSKLARAHAVTSYWEALNVWLPHPDLAPWIREFVGELTAFPASAHDDQVDAMTQALRRLYPLFGRLNINKSLLSKVLHSRL